MRVSRRLLAVPAAAVLAWSLTACGGSAPEAAPTSSASASAVAALAPGVHDGAR